MGVRITAGGLTLELAPEHGGAIAAFRLERPGGAVDLLRPMRQPGALHAGSFPMVPFANCIRDNGFRFEGTDYRVSPNMEGARLNFHGSGWQSAWSVAKQEARSVLLRLADGRVEDVYRYACEQRFRLSPDRLVIETVLTNRGARTMPFSFGHHPWFPTHGNMLAQFDAAGIWHCDADGQAVRHDAITANDDYSAPRRPPTSYLNKCYSGWSGCADIAWPDLGIGLRLEADPLFGHLMAHVPMDGQPVFCLEPQTNAPCAFDGLEKGELQPGVIVLELGESVAAGMQIQVRNDGDN